MNCISALNNETIYYMHLYFAGFDYRNLFSICCFIKCDTQWFCLFLFTFICRNNFPEHLKWLICGKMRINVRCFYSVWFDETNTVELWIFNFHTQRSDISYNKKWLTVCPTKWNQVYSDNNIHGVNMGPTWDLSAPDGPHVGPMNLAFWGYIKEASVASVKLIEAEWRIYASVNLVIIDSDNGLSPGRFQVIIWTNAGILLIGP